MRAQSRSDDGRRKLQPRSDRSQSEDSGLMYRAAVTGHPGVLGASITAGGADRLLALHPIIGNRAVALVIQRGGKPPKETIHVTPPELPEGTHSTVKHPPGSKKVNPKTEAGIWTHTNYEKVQDLLLKNAEKLTTDQLARNLVPEHPVPDDRLPPDQRPRIDRLDRKLGEVIEIKPEHLYEKGLAEAKVKAKLMDRFDPLPGGKLWRPRCVTYSQRKVMAFLRRIGYLESKAAKPPTAKRTAKPPTAKPPTAKPAPEVTVPQPKVETPPVGGAGTGATSTRLGVEASRLRTAGRFLAKEAPGLLFQAILMMIFAPQVHIHNENYGALSRQKIDPALQRALAEQAATFNKLAADDPAQSIWATVTVESEYRVETSGGDLDVYIQDLRFIEMKVTHEYLLVEGPKFQVGAGAKASKKVTYSIPIFGPATRGSEAAIRNFRTVREGLTNSAYKVRLSAMFAMYNITKADSFLKNQLVRDLQPMLSDDESIVRKVAARLLSRLKAER